MFSRMSAPDAIMRRSPPNSDSARRPSACSDRRCARLISIPPADSTFGIRVAVAEQIDAVWNGSIGPRASTVPTVWIVRLMSDNAAIRSPTKKRPVPRRRKIRQPVTFARSPRHDIQIRRIDRPLAVSVPKKRTAAVSDAPSDGQPPRFQ